MPLLFNPLKYVKRLPFHLVVSKICCMKDERGVMGTCTENMQVQRQASQVLHQVCILYQYLQIANLSHV